MADAHPSGEGTGTSLLQARTVNEVVKVQTNKVRLARLKGELVDRSQAIAHVFALARTERDAWLNWHARISSQLAATPPGKVVNKQTNTIRLKMAGTNNNAEPFPVSQGKGK